MPEPISPEMHDIESYQANERVKRALPAGAHVLVRGHINVGSTGHVMWNVKTVDHGEGPRFVYKVRFDDWRIIDTSYYEHELEWINRGSANV